MATVPIWSNIRIKQWCEAEGSFDFIVIMGFSYFVYLLYIHYMAKGMWNPDHHNHKWFFPKLSQGWNTWLYRMFLFSVGLSFPFTGTTEPKCSSMTMTLCTTNYENNMGSRSFRVFWIQSHTDDDSYLDTQFHLQCSLSCMCSSFLQVRLLCMLHVLSSHHYWSYTCQFLLEKTYINKCKSLEDVKKQLWLLLNTFSWHFHVVIMNVINTMSIHNGLDLYLWIFYWIT